MVTLQEYLNNKYKTKEERERVKEIDILEINREDEERKTWDIDKLLEGGELDVSEYLGLETLVIDAAASGARWFKTPITKLILGNKPYLKTFDCRDNRGLTELDLTNCPQLEHFDCDKNPITKIIYPNNNPQEWTWKIWIALRNKCWSEIPNISKLIDFSDLDNWVVNCDFRIGDKEYYEFCCEDGEEITCLNSGTLFSLSRKVIARKQNILLSLWKEHPNLSYESRKNIFSKLYDKFCDKSWFKEEMEENVDKVLNGELESLNKIQEFSYLNEEFRLPSTKVFWQKIRELENKNNELKNELTMEREEAGKALDKAKEWRERQIKEITEQKDEKIKELEDKLNNLTLNQIEYKK